MSLTLRIPRELKSPNKWQGRHWRYKHRETIQWENSLTVAWMLADYKERQPFGESQRSPIRRRVTVCRYVPSKRNFIRDDDNLRFSTKPLNDAMKRLGMIHDDSREWLVQGLPEQHVSPDGEWLTVVTIEPLGAPGSPEEALKEITR